MSNVKVVPVVDRRQQRSFIQLPWQLYRDNPNWMPPLIQNQRELLGYRRHPFYLDAECQTFLAVRQNDVCGRIAAIVNHAHNRHFDEQRGFFGFFECSDDADVAAALFQAAIDWLQQRGMTAVRGPMNPSFNYEMGLLIDGFERPSSFMLTYNAPYYDRLVTGFGFEKVQDLYAYGVELDMRVHIDETIWFVAREARQRLKLQLRPLDPKRFKQEIRMFLRIYNEANAAHWGFVPMSEAEVDHMSASLKHLIVPELTRIAEVDGQPVGTVFGLLDYNPIIKQINGRLFPFGFIKLFSRRKQIKRLRLVATHVVPAYQKWGVGLVLMDDLAEPAIEWGLTEGEFSWVAESNTLSRKTIERGKAVKEKTWRIYDLNID